MAEFSELHGKTLVRIENPSDELLVFHTIEGDTYKMCHYQDCCEVVSIESIVGDLNDLIGNHILLAEEQLESIWDEIAGSSPFTDNTLLFARALLSLHAPDTDKESK